MIHFGFHHLQKRKKLRQRSFGWVRFLDELMFIGAFIAPIMTVPQLAKIWQEKNAAGVSLVTWAGYLAGAVLWLVYGFVHKEKPIIAANLSLGILAAAIVLGILLYG